MRVQLILHLEDNSWWAETPEVPGFSAVESNLNTLLVTAGRAIIDILEEQRGISAANIEFSYRFASDAPLTKGLPFGLAPPDAEGDRRTHAVA